MSERDDNILFDAVYGRTPIAWAGCGWKAEYNSYRSDRERLLRYNQQLNLARAEKNDAAFVSAMKENLRQQREKLTRELSKKRKSLIYRTNQAYRILRMYKSSVMRGRIQLYIELLENGSSEIAEVLTEQKLSSQNAIDLDAKEREREKDTLICALLSDMSYFLSVTHHRSRAAIREIMSDAFMLLDEVKDFREISNERTGAAVQRYLVNCLGMEQGHSCCPVCGAIHLHGLLYCLNCGEPREDNG